MKRLILLLLLAACSHEHPLTDHQHEHTHEHTLIAHDHNLADHDHDPIAPPEVHIIWEDPAQVSSDIEPFGIGELEPFGGTHVAQVWFSQHPIGLTVKNVPDPYDRPTIPINGWFLGNRRLKIFTHCSQDTARAGGHNIAVQLNWHNGGVLLRYACPDWSEE